MKAHIQSHNSKLINKATTKEDKPCNCRKKENCPLKGQCQTEAVIYEATLQTQHGTQKYIGSTEKDFKTRYTGHKQSFKSDTKRNATALATCVWDNELNPTPPISWIIRKKSHPYKPGSKFCDICLTEKLEILKILNNSEYLNKRNEISRLCPHRDKHTLEALRQ